MPGIATTDRELLDGFVKECDSAAFQDLVVRHGPAVLQVCRAVLHDRHEAEDAFQATFLVLVRKAPVIKDPAALGDGSAGWRTVHRCGRVRGPRGVGWSKDRVRRCRPPSKAAMSWRPSNGRSFVRSSIGCRTRIASPLRSVTWKA